MWGTLVKMRSYFPTQPQVPGAGLDVVTQSRATAVLVHWRWTGSRVADGAVGWMDPITCLLILLQPVLLVPRDVICCQISPAGQKLSPRSR